MENDESESEEESIESQVTSNRYGLEGQPINGIYQSLQA